MNIRRDPKNTDQDPSLRVGGSSFWDWLSGDHDLLKKGLLVLVLLVVLFYLGRVSVYIPVLMVLSFVLCMFIFKRMFFRDCQVPVIACYDDNPTVVDVLFIGKDRFREMTIEGNPQPLSTSSGEAIYVADDVSLDSIRFSWVHETSRFLFIRKASAFDDLKQLCETSTSELYKLHNIPQVLGLIQAGKFIRKYEKDYDSLLKDEGQALEDLIDDELSELADKQAEEAASDE